MLISNQTYLRDQLIGCAKDLLEGYHVPVHSIEVEEGEVADPKLASVIRFEGDGIHGALGLMAPVSVMRSSYPVPAERDTATDEDVQGWAGELANQVLGKLKRRLLVAGFDVRTSLPHAVRPAALPRVSELEEGVSRSTYGPTRVRMLSWSSGLTPSSPTTST